MAYNKEELEAILKDWRLKKSRKLNIPAYMIMNDETLRHLASIKISVPTDLMHASGISDARYNEYGKELYKIIYDFQNNLTHDSNLKSVEIGNTVIIENKNTKEQEKYTIEQAYYEAKPVEVLKGSYSFGSVSYKNELSNSSNIDAGVILSDCDLAKKLLYKSIGDEFEFVDENGNDAIYIIKDIM